MGVGAASVAPALLCPSYLACRKTKALLPSRVKPVLVFLGDFSMSSLMTIMATSTTSAAHRAVWLFSGILIKKSYSSVMSLMDSEGFLQPQQHRRHALFLALFLTTFIQHGRDSVPRKCAASREKNRFVFPFNLGIVITNVTEHFMISWAADGILFIYR